MFSSPLQRAISRGMKANGDLVSELMKLEDYVVCSRKDAKAITAALRKLPMSSIAGEGWTSPLYALAALFQDVDGPEAPAFSILYEDGLPELIRIYQESLRAPHGDESDDLLFVLKILAMYGSREGAEEIVRAARRPLHQDAYLWHVIMSMFSDGHPHSHFVFESLSDPLPPGFLGVALLDSANQASLAGELPLHPFDNEAGWERLKIWLQDREPESYSYAHSAAAAIPFVSPPMRDQLLALALDHADSSVQIEAAWAAAKLGRNAGLKMLSRYCSEVQHADVAKQYLQELEREDLIPSESLDPAFVAKAEFTRWLSHPNELGRFPDELEIVDHRTLNWPPSCEPIPFYLIRYRVKDQTGLAGDDVDCGLVGSMTWCFFSYQMHQRPPEDVYAMHCYWEMENAGLIEETEVTDAEEYAGMLGQWQGDHLQDPKIVAVVELSPELRLQGRFLAVASAKLDAQEGWVVLDGRNSHWYSKDEQPSEIQEDAILKIHVGRQLLGFDLATDRKRYLDVAESSRSPQDTVEAYERLVAELTQGDSKRQLELLSDPSPLSQHFTTYVQCKSQLSGTDIEQIVIEQYQAFWKIALEIDPAAQEKIFDSFSVLGACFEKYIDAMVARDRSADTIAIISRLAPYWDHNLGYAQLGSAYFKTKCWDSAEQYLMKLRNGMGTYYRCEEISHLAEIWFRNGDARQAEELLFEVMESLLKDIQASPYNSDRKMFSTEYLHHRSTYLRLFPETDAALAKRGMLPDPLK